MTSSGFRGRLSAFVHPSSLSRGAPARQSQSPSPHPSPRAQRRWRKETKQSDDVLQTFHIVTETIGYILWHSVEFGRERPPWRVWGCIFCSIDTFSSQHTLLFPEFYIKQRLFILLMNAVKLDAEAGEVDHSSLLTVVLHLSQLLESFILSSFPHFTTDTDPADDEGELHKLSLTMKIGLNHTHCSSELFEHYLAMLSSAGVFESPFHSTTEVELGQSVMRVLVAAISHPDTEFYVTAAVKLSQLVTQCKLPEAASIFLLRHLSLSLSTSDHSEQANYIATIIGCVLTEHGHTLSLSDRLPGLPDPSCPSFSSSFISFSLSHHWHTFINDVLQEADLEYRQKVLLPWLQMLVERERECVEQCRGDEKLRKELTFQNEHTYEEDVLAPFFALRDDELGRQRSHDNQQRSHLVTSLQRWRGTLSFFTGERGAWSSRAPDPYVWKLTRSENFSRMRLKLSRDYSSGRHKDASHMRDVGSIPDKLLEQEPTPANTAALLSLVKVSHRSQTLDEEESLEQLAGVEGAAPGIISGDGSLVQGGKEEVVRREMCDMVQFMDRIPGQLEITTHHLFFHSSERREGHTWVTTDFKVCLDQLREIHSRRYNMQRTAIEIYLTDQTNFFLNFPSSKVVTKVYNSIVSLRTPNLTRVEILRKPARLLQSSGLTQKWVRGEISNFDYLMHLNTIAGRTYNDLNQYPVFPWVLVDFKSEELNLTDPTVFRDFTKPVGSQNPAIEQTVRERYEEFDDPMMGKFHFGSHYSNAAGILHYLIRLEPFTSLHIDLQGGRFDHADRQFFSIASSWATIYSTGTDVKELIPEFFHLPEFLENSNGYDLGKLQTGERLGPVLLPKWASSPEHFVRTHREALECEYVSSQLHHWIDLIFGYKQIGPEAEKATNLFNYYSYEGNVNLEKIEDEGERRSIESIINNFGQTPTQLFTEPHPQRMTSSEARRTLGRGKRTSWSILEHLDHIKTHCVDVSSEEDPVVFVGTPTIQTRALIASGNPEQLVTVTVSGRLNVHGWLPFSSNRSRPFTFQFDPNAHYDRSRWQSVAGPFSQDLSISPHLFVLSPNNKLLVTCGHWDNTFRVFSIERGKLLARIEHHDDVVTCMSLDRMGTGEHLITGSRDTTCVVWRFGSNEVYDHPLQTLYGHDSEVTCVDISTELDMAVSGAKDGTCIIHTVRRGHYMHTLLPRRERHKCVVRHALISPLGRLLVYTEDKLARSKDIQCQVRPPCLHLYSVNAALITEKDLSECLNDIVVVDRFLVTGNARGFLTFRDLFTLRQLNSVNLLEPITCISVVQDHHSKHASHLLVSLEKGRLIIVSVSDIPTHNKP